MLAVLGRGVDVAGRLGSLGGALGRLRHRRSPCELLLHRNGANRCGAHVHECDARTAVPDRHGADDGPVLGAALELLVREPGAARLRHLDLGEQLVRLEGGLEEAPEELGGGDGPLAAGTLDDERRVEREQQSGKVRGRIPVGDGPADRSPVSYLVVTHF